MKIIAVANSKGGVGKTTLSAALAVEAGKQGKPVCIVDTDPHEGLTDWSQRRANAGMGDNPALLRGCDTVAEALERLENARSSGIVYDWCFIDTPPGSSGEIEDAMKAADLTIVPIKPSSLDILQSETAVASAHELDVKFLIVINDAVSQDRLGENARKTLLNYELPLAKTIVRHYKAHITSMNIGKAATELSGKPAAEAKKDITALWAEIRGALK